MSSSTKKSCCKCSPKAHRCTYLSFIVLGLASLGMAWYYVSDVKSFGAKTQDFVQEAKVFVNLSKEPNLVNLPEWLSKADKQMEKANKIMEEATKKQAEKDKKAKNVEDKKEDKKEKESSGPKEEETSLKEEEKTDSEKDAEKTVNNFLLVPWTFHFAENSNNAATQTFIKEVKANSEEGNPLQKQATALVKHFNDLKKREWIAMAFGVTLFGGLFLLIVGLCMLCCKCCKRKVEEEEYLESDEEVSSEESLQVGGKTEVV